MRKLLSAVIAGIAAIAMAPSAGAAAPLNIVAIGDSTAAGTGAGDY
jgi:hypothetical protein